MSTVSIPDLPRAIGLNGNELLEIAQIAGTPGLQGYVSRSATLAFLLSIAGQAVATGPTGVVFDLTSQGMVNNYNANGAFGPVTGFLDFTPPASLTLSGLQAGFDGQIVTITNLQSGGITVTLSALSGNSILANQFRLPAARVLTQYNSQSFKYSATIGLWVTLNG